MLCGVRSASVAGDPPINDIDKQVPIANGRILGHNGNSALALEIGVIQRSLLHLLIYTEDAALMQHGVHQCGLSVVNVRNDGNIAPKRIGNRGSPHRRTNPI